MPEERAPWDTGNVETMLIGGKEFTVIKRGSDYANQVVRLTGWVSRLGSQVAMRLREMGLSPDQSSGIELAVALLSIGLEQEHLFEFGAILLGIDDTDFVEQNFDPGWMIDAVLRIWENQPGLRWTFRTIQRRFFSSTGEQKTPSEPSTSSEMPTDTQTGKSQTTLSDTETNGLSAPSD